mgnify:CR=1 FL=1
MKKLFTLVLLSATMLVAQSKDSLASLIQRGDRKAALAAIRAGADVNDAQPDGTRPIHWAVYKLDYELLEALLAKKPDVNVANAFGSMPISQAAELADVRMVKMLLDAGARPEGANGDGETALMLAVRTGNLDVVQALMNAGANVNTIEKFHHQTALMWATEAPRNAAEIVKLLLAKGADVNVRAQTNDWASQITSEPRAQYRPVGGLTALLYAARSGCLSCVEQILAKGADLNRPTPEGVTPLMIALDNDHNDVAKLLLDRGANPKLWDWWGRTALYIAVDRKASVGTPTRGRGGRGGANGPASVSHLDMIEALIGAGANVNARLNMHRPSRSGNNGRFVDPYQNTGCTPLMRAAIGRDNEAAKVLVDHGAQVDIPAMGLTPFLIAAGVGTGGQGTGLAAQSSAGGPPNMELVGLLVDHGANINVQINGTLTYSLRIARSPSSNEGMTALHQAAQTGKVALVKYLLEKGANTQLLDAKGRKPIDLAGGVALAPIAAAAGNTDTNRQRDSDNPAITAEIKSLLQNVARK